MDFKISARALEQLNQNIQKARSKEELLGTLSNGMHVNAAGKIVADAKEHIQPLSNKVLMGVASFFQKLVSNILAGIKVSMRCLTMKHIRMRAFLNETIYRL